MAGMASATPPCTRRCTGTSAGQLAQRLQARLAHAGQVEGVLDDPDGSVAGVRAR